MNPPLRKDLAAALGLSPASITALAARGMPTTSVAAARAWRRRNLAGHRTKDGRVDSVGSGRRPTSPAYIAARTARELADADLALHELQRRRAMLVNPAAVRRELDSHLRALREAAGRIPGRLADCVARETDPARVHRLLEDAVLDLLQAAVDGAHSGSLPDTGSHEDPSGPDRTPVAASARG